jgi:uncharacterized protein YkwD
VRFVLSLLVASCAGSVQPPAWRQESRPAPTAELVPEGAPAARYNDGGPPVPATPLVARVVQTVADVAERTGKSAPAVDGRLCAVAADLADLVPQGPPPYDAEEFALAYRGIIEPSPHLVAMRLEDVAENEVLDGLRAQLPPILAAASFVRLGVAVTPRSLVVALQESGVETDPIPRELPHGGAARLRGRVLHPYSGAKVYVTDTSGAVASVPVTRDGPSGFRADVGCGVVDGPIKVEIAADDGRGNPTVLANFPIFCGATAPRAHALAPPGSLPSDAPSAEREIFELANRERARAGLAPFVWDDRAAEIARRHASEMRDKEFVSHVSPTTGTLSDRARAGGLATPLLLENLARAYSPAEVHDGLMNSPGHRANLLNPQATHLGIGVALGKVAGGRRELYVTQLFFRVTPRVDVAEARAQALTALAKARARLPALAEDPELDALAQRYAGGLASGQTRDRLDRASDSALDALPYRFRQVRTIIAVTGDPADSIRDDAVDPSARYFGLGLAQGHHAALGDGAFFVVIMFATAR